MVVFGAVAQPAKANPWYLWLTEPLGEMTGSFQPDLGILPPPQRRLWDELGGVPEEFVLYGGTALALHLGHRQSVDFDFFGNRPFDPSTLVRRLPFLREAAITQQEPNTLSATVERGGPVLVSFFGVPDIARVRPPHIAPDNGLHIASLLDLAGSKAAVVQQRAEAKDYRDLDAIFEDGRVDLPAALACALVIYGPKFNPQITLKALSFFGDGNLSLLPRSLQDRLARAAREVDLDRLPAIDRGGRPMKAIPLTPEMETVVRRLIWFEPPAEALADPVRFMAYAMARATHEEMKIIRQYVGEADFLDALDHAPAGIIDRRSWAYWNSKMGRYPAPPEPKRRLE